VLVVVEPNGDAACEVDKPPNENEGCDVPVCGCNGFVVVVVPKPPNGCAAKKK
jgi:hypothetical protein